MALENEMTIAAVHYLEVSFALTSFIYDDTIQCAAPPPHWFFFATSLVKKP